MFTRNPVIVNKRSACSEDDLLQAYYEHCVREIIRDFVTSVLQQLSHADLEFYRLNALTLLKDMLPYSRLVDLMQTSLSLVVNKFGDGARKVQCHAINILVGITRSFGQQTEMAEEAYAIILREIGLFLARPGTKPSHRVYALGFLNKSAAAIAYDLQARATLLAIYFNLFNKLLHQDPQAEQAVKAKKDRNVSKKERKRQEKLARAKKGEVDDEDNKVIELVLKGVNIILLKSGSRVDADLRKVLTEQTNLLFKLTHHKVFRIQLQTLKLLFQFALASEKFEAQIEPVQLVKEDEAEDGERVGGSFSDRFYRTLYEVVLRVQLAKAAKMDEYFGLIFRAMKADPNVVRVVSFLKRLLQMCFINEANFAAATLLVVSEILRSRKDVRYEIFQFDAGSKAGSGAELKNVMSLDAIGKAGADEQGSGGDSDDEEVFKDVDRVQAEKKHTETAERKQFNSKYTGSKQYDPLKREPKYSNAENSPLWELASLAYHCHPTVCLWAEKLLVGDLIDYGGDPLLDFGLANFLDRVTYKSPKTAEKAEKYRKRMAQFEKPINEYNFQEGEAPETQREEEQFLYKYM